MHIFFNCAASDKNDMSLSWGLTTSGYDALLLRFLKILEKIPGAVPFLHLPFGRPRKLVDGVFQKEGPMELSSIFELQMRGYKHLVDSYIKCWRGMPNGVISYFGSPHNDRRCKKALSTEGYFDNYLYILWKSLRPSLEIGSDIAFDNAGGIQPSTSIFHEATHNLIKFINIKRNSWIEATPALSNKEMYGYSNIITDKLFKQRHEIPQHPGVLGQYPVIGDSNWYSGQTSVIMFQGDYNSIEDSAARIEKLRSYGMIPCLHFVLAEKLINEGLI